MRVLPKLLLLLVLAGCEQPAPYGPSPGEGRTLDQFIQTNARFYPAGAVVSIRITNPAQYTIAYNLCRSNLEIQSDDGWRRVQTTLAEVCTAELRSLRPGQTASYAFRSSPHLKPGPYRVTTLLQDARNVAGGFEVVSNIFNIQRESNY